MKRNSRAKRWFAAISCLSFGLAACSTMNLKQYPEPSLGLFDNSRSVNGVLTYAQPLLDEKRGEEYFGVNLIQKGILAVYLSVKNNNPNASFTIPAESIYISQIETNDLTNNPEKGDQELGEGTAIVGALLINPLFLAIGAQQLSDASIIKENFAAKRFRTKTIDPGQNASGFSYFNWTDFKKLDRATICFDLIDPLADKTFPFCQKINLRR